MGGWLFISCEGEVRTPDLWVMSPTSYRCSTSRCKGSRMKLTFQTKLLLKSKFFIRLNDDPSF